MFQFFAIKTLIMWFYDRLMVNVIIRFHGNRITKGVVFLVTSVTTDSTNFVRKAKNLKWRGQIG